MVSAQLALAENVPTQLLVEETKSLGLFPATTTEVMCRVALPEFVTVTVEGVPVVP